MECNRANKLNSPVGRTQTLTRGAWHRVSDVPIVDSKTFEVFLLCYFSNGLITPGKWFMVL